MTQFFMQDGDETRMKNARLADDLDLVPSKQFIGPWGPALVAVAMHSGVHVCWYCHDMFQGQRARRPVEVRHGHAYILLHAGCVGKKPRTFDVVSDLVRGHQLRREASRVVKASVSIDDAAGVTESVLNDELFASARKLLAKMAPTEVPDPPEETSEEDVPLIQLAGGLDTLTTRETSSTENGDNVSP